MARLFICVVLALLMTSCSENTSDNKPLSDDLAQLENDWMQAMMKRDQSILEQIVAPEFTVTGMKYIDSAAVTRTVWMQNIMQDMQIDSVHFIKMKVDRKDDVGIVRAYFYWSGRYGNPFADSTSFVDTWVKRNGSWRVISRIITD